MFPSNVFSFLRMFFFLDYEPNLSNIFPIPGSRHRFKRVGRGIAAGQGGSCGRGMRGQKSRAGNGAGVRIGFEGGQTPLYRRIPKYVGRTNKYLKKPKYKLVKLHQLNNFIPGEIIDKHIFFARGMLGKSTKKKYIYKIVGGSAPLTIHNLTVKAHAFTAPAREAIENNNGTCILMSKTKDIPLQIAEREKLEKLKYLKLRLKMRKEKNSKAVFLKQIQS